MWHVIGWYGYPWAPVNEPMCRTKLPRNSFTIGKGLQEAGYKTACIGKWHLTYNKDGHYVGLNPEAAKYYGFDYAPRHSNSRYHQSQDKGVPWLTDRAIEFMDENTDDSWFIYLSHHTIHGPVLAPIELIQKYRDRGAPENGLHNATYLASIEALDNSVGRLLKHLDDTGKRDNTIVVFLTDNGGVHEIYDKADFRDGNGRVTQLEVLKTEFSNAPLRAGKGSMYEGGIRVPCLVRWPGVINPGTVERTPIHIIDWMPTLFEAAGAKAPKDHVVDGDSLVSLFKGQKMKHRSLYWYLPLYDLRWGATPCSIIREGDFKLIEFYGDRFDQKGRYIQGHQWELYNLKNDIGETTNLAMEHPARADRMRKKLREWIRSIPAEIPAPNPHHDLTRPLKETNKLPSWKTLID